METDPGLVGKSGGGGLEGDRENAEKKTNGQDGSKGRGEKRLGEMFGKLKSPNPKRWTSNTTQNVVAIPEG